MAYGENIFTAMIGEDGTIWEASTGRKRQAVGIDSQKQQEYVQTISEMQETIDNYYGKLVELGAISIPKSPEQIAQETAAEQLRISQEQAAQQAEINQALLEAITGLKSEIKELKENGSNRCVDEPSGEGVGSVSKSGRSPGRPSKESLAKRAANAS